MLHESAEFEPLTIMGFGYLTIGYLLISILYLTAQALGVGSLVTFAGYALMTLGVWSLSRFHSAFLFSKWSVLLGFVPAIFALLSDASTLFLWDMPFLAALSVPMQWAKAVVEVIFLFSVLYGIRMLSRSLELKKIDVAGARNTIAVGVWAILFLVLNGLSLSDAVRPYVGFGLQLVNFAVILLNLALFLSCTKNICAEGDEEIEERPSRFAFLNRMHDAYKASHARLNEQARADGEALLNRHRKNQEKKRKHKKKKK